MIPRILARAVVLVVLVASGAYFFIYLTWWEWSRAHESGLIFVAALIALVASVLLRRLKAIEDRIEQLQDRPAPQPAALDAIRSTAPSPPDRFAWLREPESRSNVFIPVLLGAGVLLSGVAAVVERIAGATAKPVLEHRLALRLQPLALPAGGLPGSAVPGASAPHRRGGLVVRVLAVVVAAVVLSGAIKVIADATQTRRDPDMSGKTTSLVFTVRQKGATSRDEYETAEALWTTCRSRLRRDLPEDPVDLGEGRVGVDITPGLGQYALRPIEGCLEDHTLDRVSGHLVSSTTRPS